MQSVGWSRDNEFKGIVKYFLGDFPPPEKKKKKTACECWSCQALHVQYMLYMHVLFRVLAFQSEWFIITAMIISV